MYHHVVGGCVFSSGISFFFLCNCQFPVTRTCWGPIKEAALLLPICFQAFFQYRMWFPSQMVTALKWKSKCASTSTASSACPALLWLRSRKERARTCKLIQSQWCRMRAEQRSRYYDCCHSRSCDATDVSWSVCLCRTELKHNSYWIEWVLFT